MSATTRQPGAALRRPSAEEQPGPRLFPGDRRVWLLGLALGLLVLGIALVWLATTRETYAGTNSVVVRSVAAQAGPGEALCVPGVDIPDHTGAVRFAAFWRGERRPGFDLRLRAGATTRTATVPRVPGASPVIGARVDIPVRPVELDSESRSGRVCVTPRGASAEFGGMLELPGDQQAPTVAGEPLAARIAIWFLPPEGEERSLLAHCRGWPSARRCSVSAC